MKALAKVVTWWDESSFELVSDYISRGDFREFLELPGWQQVEEHFLEPIDERHIIEIDDAGAICSVIKGSESMVEKTEWA